MKRLLEKIRNFRAFASERRTRAERARLNALLIVAGGSLTMPRKRWF
jgi:hypothetical protein